MNELKLQPGQQSKHVEFAIGDAEFVLVTTDKNNSYINLYSFDGIMDGKDTKSNHSITFPDKDYGKVTQASFGPVNKKLYISTE
jgi:hypothetical protein